MAPVPPPVIASATRRPEPWICSMSARHPSSLVIVEASTLRIHRDEALAPRHIQQSVIGRPQFEGVASVLSKPQRRREVKTRSEPVRRSRTRSVPASW
jgi:hypothetical protein